MHPNILFSIFNIFLSFSCQRTRINLHGLSPFLLNSSIIKCHKKVKSIWDSQIVAWIFKCLDWTVLLVLLFALEILKNCKGSIYAVGIIAIIFYLPILISSAFLLTLVKKYFDKVSFDSWKIFFILFTFQFMRKIFFRALLTINKIFL